VLVVIGDGGAPQAPEAPASERVRATPLVRRLAQELGVDLATVTATGAQGRITEADVRAAGGGQPAGEGRRAPLRGVRRQIAQHLATSHREVAAVQRLAEAARSGALKPEELRGSTFTITSAGKLAGLFATPLVNHPEVAILGVHRIAARPAVVDGEVAVRRIGNLSVTFDHRVVDGARAAAFVLAVIDRLERAARRTG